jgi:2-amino-4-hydroxy-6-hydroxymethyldihydropteridine diphosphokinase
MPTVLVSLGANLGDREATIGAAIAALAEFDTAGFRVSGLRTTAPVGGPAGQGPFVNAVARLESAADPDALLAQLQKLECDGGRNRDQRWSARTLDLDLLAVGDALVETHALRLPHPRMTFRPFVLEPAAEVAPEWRHPELGVTLAELWGTLRGGRESVGVSAEGTLASEVASLVRAMRPRMAVEYGSAPLIARAATQRGAPRLWIDAADAPTPAGCGPRSPRLRLADCPREDWSAEVRAALECVWPGGA